MWKKILVIRDISVLIDISSLGEIYNDITKDNKNDNSFWILANHFK